MNWVLTVCLAFNTWIDTCGRYLEVKFQTEEQCRVALQDFKSQPAFSYGFCAIKEKK